MSLLRSAVLACGALAGCRALIGIDEPNVIGDDGGPIDATVDVPGDGTVDAGSWVPCRTRPPSGTSIFCDDFDDPGENVGFKWSGPPAGPIASTSTALTAPLAFRSALPAPTSAYAYAALSTPLALPDVQAFTYRFSVNGEMLGATPGGYLGVASVHFADASCVTQGTEHQRRVDVIVTSTGQLELFVVGLGRACGVGTGDDTKAVFAGRGLMSTGAPPQWTELALRVSRGPCTGSAGSSVALFADGLSVVCAPLGIDPMTVATGLKINLGVSVGKPWGATALDYDDVDVTVE